MTLMTKKKILILGANGLLGSRIFINLSKIPKLNVVGMVRNKINHPLFKKNTKIISNIDIKNLKKLEDKIRSLKPDYIINCIGITNKKINENKNSESVFVNSFLPHYLDRISSEYKFKLIHISTDCVFAGKRKSYSEKNLSDVKDIYGLSKFIGEVKDTKNLTIRTSIIGHELNEKNGLVEWFLSQKKVFGFKNVIYSGVTTNELSEILVQCIMRLDLKGLYQVSSKPISKYDLLKLIANIYKKNIKIKKNTSVRKKLVLNSTKFTKKTKYRVKSWVKQINIMKKEKYEN